MGFFTDLLGAFFSGGGGGNDRYRHKGRYGKKGAYRKQRNGDLLGRGKNGRYKK